MTNDLQWLVDYATKHRPADRVPTPADPAPAVSSVTATSAPPARGLAATPDTVADAETCDWLLAVATGASQSAPAARGFSDWHRDTWQLIEQQGFTGRGAEQVYAAMLRAGLAEGGGLAPEALLSLLPEMMPQHQAAHLGRRVGAPEPVRGPVGTSGFRQNYERGAVAFLLFSEDAANDGSVIFIGERTNAPQHNLHVLRPASWLRPNPVALPEASGPAPSIVLRRQPKAKAKPRAEAAKPRSTPKAPPQLRLQGAEVRKSRKASPWTKVRFRPVALPKPTVGFTENVLRDPQRQIVARLASDPAAEKGATVGAPTGTGKTVLATARIEEWLTQLQAGESILVVAPDLNVGSQWLRTLCHKKWRGRDGELRGPLLSSDQVFCGKPSQLMRAGKNGQARPAITILSAAGFERACRDGNGVSDFAAALGTKHVVLDEIHQWVATPGSPYHGVVQSLRALSEQGKLSSVVGLSATTAGVAEELEALGMPVVVDVQPEDLLATGFMPPHSIRGAISTLSASESRINEALLSLKKNTGALLQSLDSVRLRGTLKDWFEKDREKVVSVFLNELERYSGSPAKRRKDVLKRIYRLAEGDEADGVEKKLTSWDLDLLAAVQLLEGLSDEAFYACYAADASNALSQREAMAAVGSARDVLEAELKLPGDRALLGIPAHRAMGHTPRILGPQATESERRREVGATAAGLYQSIRDYRARSFGLGLTETIAALHTEETRARAGIAAAGPRSGNRTLVFARTQTLKRLDPHVPVDLSAHSAPGLVLGLAQRLGADGGVIAVQTNQAILPDDPALRARIVECVRTEVLEGELVDVAVAELSTKLSSGEAEVAEAILKDGVQAFVDRLLRRGGVRAGGHHVENLIESVTKALDASALGASAKTKIRSRFDSAALRSITADMARWCVAATKVARAETYQGRTVDGGVERFALVSFGSYADTLRSLFARAIDSDAVGIELGVFTQGSATGMDIQKIGTVVSADGVANKKTLHQRKGRGLRPDPALSQAESDALGELIGVMGLSRSRFPGVSDALWDRLHAIAPGEAPVAELSDSSKRIAVAALRADDAPSALIQTVESGQLSLLSDVERLRVAEAITLAYNKVSHYWEVYEYRPGERSRELRTGAAGELSRNDKGTAKFDDLQVMGPDGRLGTGHDRAPIVNPRLDATPEGLKEILRADLAPRIRAEARSALVAAGTHLRLSDAGAHAA